MRRLRSTPGQVSLGQLFHDGSVAGLLVILVTALAVTAAYQWLALTHPFPLDYGESPLLDQALRLAAGRNLYRPELAAPPFTISNYPPLYVAVLAPWLALLGPSFAVGRLVSSLCAWMAAACLALIVYTHTRDRLAAALAAQVFITLPYVTFWSGFMRVDLLALALSLAALTVVVRWPAARWSVGVAALLLVASIFTRQSYALAAPLAATVWLWVAAPNRRHALGLAGLVGGLSLALFLLLQVVTAGGFYFNIVTANVNEFRRDILTDNLEGLLDDAWPLLGLAGASLFLGPRRSPLYALAAPFLVGGLLSALTIGKIGSNVNYLLELCAGLGLAAGAVLGWTRQPRQGHWLAAGVMALLVTQGILSLRTTVTSYAVQLADRRALTNELYRLQAMVAEVEGPVLADEYMGLSVLEGRPLFLQPFEVTQLAWAGVWDQSPLLDSLEQQAFELILIYDRPWLNERWTHEMLDTIKSNYRLTAHVADTRVYRPFNRQAAAASADACPGAPWRLPTSAAFGLESLETGLMFLSGANDGTEPVLAVADGLLTRRRDWVDAVAIEHDDPLHPGQTVWTYYADLAASDERTSHIAPEFPLGTEGVRVHAGQVLGYQGTWSGRKYWPAWVHARFAVVRGPEPGVFPKTVTPAVMLDPAPYLGLVLVPTEPGGQQQLVRCGGQ